MSKMKALFIITNAGFAEEIVDIAREQGASGATILNARGAGQKHQVIMGMTIDSEKEMILSVVKEEIALKIMEAVKEKAGIGTPAHAICFFAPVERMTETAATQNAAKAAE